MLAPGGRIALSVWCDSTAPGYPPFIPAFERHLTDPSAAVGFVRAIFALHDDRELERLLTTAGFRDVRITRATISAHVATGTRVGVSRFGRAT